MNTALAPGTEEILLGTFLMSRNVLDSKTISKNAVHDLVMAFLLLAMDATVLGSRPTRVQHWALYTVTLLA